MVLLSKRYKPSDSYVSAEDSEEEHYKGLDKALVESTEALGDGRHNVDGKEVTIWRPREGPSAMMELSGMLADELRARSEEDTLPDLNRQWLASLADEEKIGFLYETLHRPHPAKYDEILLLAERYLFDERDNGASQLMPPMRKTLELFFVQGCPRKVLQDLYGLSGTALDKMQYRIGRRSPRFRASRAKPTQTVGATLLHWKARLYRFSVIALVLYSRFPGRGDEFYALMLKQFIETGEFHPDLISQTKDPAKEAER